MRSARVIHADCRDAMRDMAENSVDAVICDPPYELGFLGSAWDRTGIAFDGPVWREALRVLRPGGHCLVFGATRTYHRVACAVEDAGFEIREMFIWIHGQGMNKVGYLREADGETHIRPGWGGAVRPMVEPIVVARKPLGERTLAENMRRWGLGGFNVDGCRVGTGEDRSSGCRQGSSPHPMSWGHATRSDRPTGGRWPPNLILDGSQAVLDLFPEARCAGNVNPTRQNIGYGSTADRKALPINHADSGSAARFFPSFPPDDAPARYCPKAPKSGRVSRCTSCGWRTMGKTPPACPSCGAAGEKTWASHPTVKPVALLRWLCRLVTPTGGTILDPFAGSGTTLAAALAEGFDAIGVEQDATFIADIHHRLGLPLAEAAE